MHLPSPLRAAVGLAVTVAEESRRLPDRAIELPMLAVSTALQASIRVQQRYARLAARGEEVLNPRPVTDDAPDWATFDAPVGGGRRLSAFDLAPDPDGGPATAPDPGASDPTAPDPTAQGADRRNGHG